LNVVLISCWYTLNTNRDPVKNLARQPIARPTSLRIHTCSCDISPHISIIQRYINNIKVFERYKLLVLSAAEILLKVALNTITPYAI
jgi:hypothetical protein